MKAKIFSFVKVADDSMVASARIARFVGDTLQIPICWDDTVFDDGAQDVLIIVGGAYAFAGSRILETLGNAIQTAKRLVWIQNDFTVIPPKDESGAESPFRKAFRVRSQSGMAPTDYWTTVEAMSTPGYRSDRTGNGWRIGPGSFYVNWNALTFDADAPVIPFFERSRDNQLLYYGSFRKGREQYFDRYLRPPIVRTVISSPTRKFEERFNYENITHELKISIPLSVYLGNHGLGLYLEDKQSHSEFHSPANRFYEMMSAGLPMVFQPEACRMMSRAGYDVDEFVVWGPSEIAEKMKIRDAILDQQRELWYEKAKREHESLTPLITQNWEKYL